jgi:hypothetical protein
LLRSRARAWPIVLGLLVSAPRATAEPAAPRDDAADAARGERVVAVAIAADPEEYGALCDALSELVGRLGLKMEPQRADEPPWSSGAAAAGARRGGAVRARVWIDARAAARVDVAVSVAREGTFGRAVERSVARADSGAIVVEQVAHVVHATLDSMLVESLPEPPPPAPSAPPAPAPPPPREAHVRSVPAGFGLDAAAFATTGAVVSGSGPVLGGGVALALLAGRLPMHPRLWLTAAFDASFDTVSDDMVLETSISSFRALPSVELLATSAVRIELAAGGGIDLFHTIPRDARRPLVELLGARTDVDPVLAAELIADLRVAWTARVFVGAGLDYDLGLHRYLDIQRMGEVVVMQPWPLRPVGLLGLRIPLAGETAYEGAE